MIILPVVLSLVLHLSTNPPPTFTGHAVLAGAEENQQSQLGADEAFTGTRRCGKNQVGHGVGRGVDPPQAGAAQTLPTCDGLQTLQPEGQHTALTVYAQINFYTQTLLASAGKFML